MNTDPIMLSPAKRARRCVLKLLACLVVVAGVYAGFHSDHWLFKRDGVIEVASSDVATEKGSSPASSLPVVGLKDSRSSASVKLSMAGLVASAYLVTPDAKQ